MRKVIIFGGGGAEPALHALLRSGEFFVGRDAGSANVRRFFHCGRSLGVSCVLVTNRDVGPALAAEADTVIVAHDADRGALRRFSVRPPPEGFTTYAAGAT